MDSPRSQLGKLAPPGVAADVSTPPPPAPDTLRSEASGTARAALVGLGHSSGSGLAIGVDLALTALARQVAA